MVDVEHPLTTEQASIDARERLASARRAIVTEQLRSREGIAGLRAWRGLDRLGRGVRKVRRGCDAIAAARRIGREASGAGEAEKALSVFSVRVCSRISTMGFRASGCTRHS